MASLGPSSAEVSAALFDKNKNKKIGTLRPMEKGKSRPLFFPFPFSVSTHRTFFFSFSSVSLSAVCREERAKERQTFFEASECYISLGCWVHERTVSFAEGAKWEQMQGLSCFSFVFFFLFFFLCVCVCEFFFFFFFAVIVACDQALHLGDILKSSCARGTQTEIRVLSRLASLAGYRDCKSWQS